MRRKQLFMIALTGALVTGSVPGTVWAAENGVEATSEEGSPAVDAGEDTTEESSEPAATEAPAEPTEAPATEAPAEPTEAPATDAPAEPQNTEPAEEPVATEEAQEDAGTETEEDRGITIGEHGEQKFATLNDAVAYVKSNPEKDENDNLKATVINVSKPQTIDKTIEIKEGCKVCINATSPDVIFTRVDGFIGSVFSVSGKNSEGDQSELQLKAADGATFTVKGAETDGLSTLVSVSDNGIFGMFTGVTLSGNKTSDNGGAITNNGGSLLLAGGTITGNTGSKGGVYSNASVGVQGDIRITDNKGEKDATANLYLDGSDSTMVVMGTVADSAKLNFSLATVPETGKPVTVAKVGTKEGNNDLVTAEEFKTAVEKMVYDAATTSDEFEAVAVSSSDSKTAVLKKKETSTPEDPKKPGTGEVGVPKYDSSTKKVTFNIKGTEDFTYYVAAFPIGEKEKTVLSKFDKKKATNKAKKDTKTSVTYDNYDKTTDLWVYFQWPDGSVSCEKEVLFLPTISGVTWTDHNTVQFKLAANHPFHYYSTVTKSTTTSAEVKAAYDASKAETKVPANEKKQLIVKNIPENDKKGKATFQIWVYFKMNDGTMKYSKIPISTDKRPGKSTNTRDPYPHTINDCKVSGLEEAMKFYPGVFYEFAVTGAGTEITNPVTGDEKYEPLYWSTSKTPEDDQKNKSWKIGSAKGITDASTYNMYIFFQKYRYNGSEWIPGDIEYKTVQFKAAEITEDDLNNWKKENGVTTTPGDGDGTGSGGSGTDAELTATAAAQDSSSSSKSAVSTADESPIGTMSALMALSLLAGGYVLIRKRKKEDL